MNNLLLRNPESAPLLTRADIIDIKRELDEKRLLLEHLPQQIEGLQRRFDAAMFFAPAGFSFEDNATAPLNGVPQPEVHKRLIIRRITWASEILRILESEERGWSHSEILNEISKSALAKKRVAGDKPYYNQIFKLNKDKKIVKKGGLIYSTEVFARLKESGMQFPDREPKFKPGTSSEIVFKILEAEYPKALLPLQLGERAGKVPGAPSSLVNHKHFIYTVITQLLAAKAIKRKNDGSYVAVLP